MRRPLIVPALAVLAVLLASGPAWAHNEFDPAQAGTSKVIALQLNVANERDDAGTTMVELFFPEGIPIALAALPPIDGWTITPNGGTVGGPVTSVTWSRPTASPDENPSLPLSVGPMPTDPIRLQFKALQTYSDGEVERWIDDWRAGAPEPQHPGPVLDVVVDGPGDIAPPPTSASTAPALTSTTATTVAPTPTTALISPPVDVDDDNDDGGSYAGLIAGIIAAAVVIAAIVGVVIARRRRGTQPPPSDGGSSGP
jgi:periplasmic copper chaperone A